MLLSRRRRHNRASVHARVSAGLYSQITVEQGVPSPPLLPIISDFLHVNVDYRCVGLFMKENSTCSIWSFHALTCPVLLIRYPRYHGKNELPRSCSTKKNFQFKSVYLLSNKSRNVDKRIIMSQLCRWSRRRRGVSSFSLLRQPQGIFVFCSSWIQRSSESVRLHLPLLQTASFDEPCVLDLLQSTRRYNLLHSRERNVFSPPQVSFPLWGPNVAQVSSIGLQSLSSQSKKKLGSGRWILDECRSKTLSQSFLLW